MPPPPNYDCPVCKKGFQRGHLGRHIVTHEKKDLIGYVINADTVATANWHPEFNCSGHTYIICSGKREGFEKDKLLHKKHVCSNDYSNWLILPPENTIVENTVVEKKTDVLEEEEEINAIDMVLPEDPPIPKTQCYCHIEITRLQTELQELQKWRDLVLQSAPGGSPNPKILTKEPEKKEKKQEQEQQQPQAPQQQQAQQQQPQAQQQQQKPPQKKSAKPKIQASKKEIEKGMWCVECSACRTIAQFATDLRECCNCKKLSHFNDDLTGCYHWDCTTCSNRLANV
jgi:hypothetical protein